MCFAGSRTLGAVLGLVSWWLGSGGTPTAVRDFVARKFKADDVFTAWCKFKECEQLAAGLPVQAPPRHRAETKLAEELVKDITENEKNGGITIVVPATELGLVKGRIEGCISEDRPLAARLESLEDIMKGVVEKLGKVESNQMSMARATQISVQQPVVQQPVVQQPVVQQPVVKQPGPLYQPDQVGSQPQSYAAAAASGLSFASNPLFQMLQGTRPRRNSLSVKRSVSGAARDVDGNTNPEDVFTEVNGRKKKKKEVSTGTATL